MNTQPQCSCLKLKNNLIIKVFSGMGNKLTETLIRSIINEHADNAVKGLLYTPDDNVMITLNWLMQIKDLASIEDLTESDIIMRVRAMQCIHQLRGTREEPADGLSWVRKMIMGGLLEMPQPGPHPQPADRPQPDPQPQPHPQPADQPGPQPQPHPQPADQPGPQLRGRLQCKYTFPNNSFNHKKGGRCTKSVLEILGWCGQHWNSKPARDERERRFAAKEDKP